MSSSAVTERPSDVDIPLPAGFLAAHVPGFRGPARLVKFPGGQSNPTYRIDAASGSYVLRRRPSGPLLPSAHAIDREYRVQKALAGTPVPVAPMLAFCDDPAVIGTDFYVMAHVPGRIFWDPALPELNPAGRAAVYDAMNGALAALHGVDPAAVGLADYGRPGNYFARQMGRWTSQYRASETEMLPGMDDLIAWLQANIPADDGRSAIVHGDFRIDNLIFHPDEARVLAILDWELSTLGHPLADLAYQCMQWRLPNDGPLRGLGGLDRTALGIPSEEAYVARYCERVGMGDLSAWTFALAFSFFRVAAILQGVKKRALSGNASNPESGLRIASNLPVIVRSALEVIAAAR